MTIEELNGTQQWLDEADVALGEASRCHYDKLAEFVRRLNEHLKTLAEEVAKKRQEDAFFGKKPYDESPYQFPLDKVLRECAEELCGSTCGCHIALAAVAKADECIRTQTGLEVGDIVFKALVKALESDSLDDDVLKAAIGWTQVSLIRRQILQTLLTEAERRQNNDPERSLRMISFIEFSKQGNSISLEAADLCGDLAPQRNRILKHIATHQMETAPHLAVRALAKLALWPGEKQRGEVPATLYEIAEAQKNIDWRVSLQALVSCVGLVSLVLEHNWCSLCGVMPEEFVVLHQRCYKIFEEIVGKNLNAGPEEIWRAAKKIRQGDIGQKESMGAIDVCLNIAERFADLPFARDAASFVCDVEKEGFVYERAKGIMTRIDDARTEREARKVAEWAENCYGDLSITTPDKIVNLWIRRRRPMSADVEVR